MSDSKYYIISNPVEQNWDRTRTARESSDRHRYIGPLMEASARCSTDGTMSIVEVDPREGDPTGVRIVAGPMRDAQCRAWLVARRSEWQWIFPGEEEPIR